VNRNPIGISAFSPWLPRLRVDLREWCRWTGRPESRVLAGTGTGFRMAGPREDAYTMAAAAVMRLVRTGTVDPARVGFLALATESSRDSAVGAVIVKGLVDLALAAEGRPPLARDCEVPEFKQACLAGVYAMKAAARWLAWDGRGRQAIVVASDVATYARGSTGEPTQGAGAVAVLLEEAPALLVLDLDAAASTSAFRGVDFRKPVLRHFLARDGGRPDAPDEYPVFDGPYSTTCYLDETLRVVEALARRLDCSVHEVLDRTSLAVFHRPYRKMPRDALALVRLRALVGPGGPADRRDALCRAAGVAPDLVRAELAAGPLPGASGDAAWPNVATAWRALRLDPAFLVEAEARLGWGEALLAECGNLYAASILAWLAAGLEEAADAGRDLAGTNVLAVGYGSGDAADASILRVADQWRDAARHSRFTAALAGAIALDREAYEAVHDGRPAASLPDLTSDGFGVDRVGWNRGPRGDAGVEHYTYEPGQTTDR
jgi:hydroxymethylglutaryl-CoA synthase